MKRYLIISGSRSCKDLTQTSRDRTAPGKTQKQEDKALIGEQLSIKLCSAVPVSLTRKKTEWQAVEKMESL